MRRSRAANEKSVTGGVTPIGMPMIVAATMEISRAPLRLTAVSTTATMMEMAATNGRSGW